MMHNASRGNYVSKVTLIHKFLTNNNFQTFPSFCALFSYKCYLNLNFHSFLGGWVNISAHHNDLLWLSFILTFYSFLLSHNLNRKSRLWYVQPYSLLWWEKNGSGPFLNVFKYFWKDMTNEEALFGISHVYLHLQRKQLTRIVVLLSHPLLG